MVWFHQEVCVSSVSMQRYRGMKGIRREPVSDGWWLLPAPGHPRTPTARPLQFCTKLVAPWMWEVPCSLQSWDGESQIPWGSAGHSPVPLPAHPSLPNPLGSSWLHLWLYSQGRWDEHGALPSLAVPLLLCTRQRCVWSSDPHGEMEQERVLVAVLAPSNVSVVPWEYLLKVRLECVLTALTHSVIFRK